MTRSWTIIKKSDLLEAVNNSIEGCVFAHGGKKIGSPDRDKTHIAVERTYTSLCAKRLGNYFPCFQCKVKIIICRGSNTLLDW